MKAVVQRVKASAVSVDGETIGKIGKGYNVLLGVFPDDTKKDAEILAAKIAKLRIFEDEDEKMNMSILDVDGEVLAISQFTLCADIKKGNSRPSQRRRSPTMPTSFMSISWSSLRRTASRRLSTVHSERICRLKFTMTAPLL